MRNQHIWMASLRSKERLAREIGLKEIHLKYNKLSTMTVQSLSKFIQGDEYLRVLDLSHNQIPERVLLEEFIPSLRANKTLTNVDLRENPGYTAKVARLVALCLLKNIDRLKRKVQGAKLITKSWLNQEVLRPAYDADASDQASSKKRPHKRSQSRASSAKQTISAQEIKRVVMPLKGGSALPPKPLKATRPASAVHHTRSAT